MSSLAEEVGDLFHIMVELLVTKRAFDCVEWKNFSKLLKDIHCYLTVSMLFFWIYKFKKTKLFVEYFYFSTIWSTWKYCSRYYFNLKFLLGANEKNYTKKGNNMNNQVYKNYTMPKECCSHSNILLLIFRGWFAES